jgi:hypothetical protein
MKKVGLALCFVGIVLSFSSHLFPAGPERPSKLSWFLWRSNRLSPFGTTLMAASALLIVAGVAMIAAAVLEAE